MDTCTVETGLLKKKPCGHAAVTHCVNCEQALCSQHAIAQTTEAGAKSGKFMCKECDAARRQFAKNAPPPARKPAEPATAAKPPAAGAKPVEPAKEAPAAPKPADDGGALEFTPSKDKK